MPAWLAAVSKWCNNMIPVTRLEVCNRTPVFIQCMLPGAGACVVGCSFKVVYKKVICSLAAVSQLSKFNSIGECFLLFNYSKLIFSSIH